MERTWKLPKDRNWTRKEEPPARDEHHCVGSHWSISRARRELTSEVRAHSLNDDDDDYHHHHHHHPSLMPLRLHSGTWRTAETTEHRCSLLSMSSLLFFIFHPPIPALQTLQGINGSLSKQLKVAVTRSSPERRLWESGWVHDSTVLGVFRASLLWYLWTGAVLIEFDLMFLTGSDSELCLVIKLLPLQPFFSL